MPAAIMDAPEDLLIDRQVTCWHAAKESQKITSAEENCANMLSCWLVDILQEMRRAGVSGLDGFSHRSGDRAPQAPASASFHCGTAGAACPDSAFAADVPVPETSDRWPCPNL